MWWVNEIHILCHVAVVLYHLFLRKSVMFDEQDRKIKEIIRKE
jgi:hypothetical protein